MILGHKIALDPTPEPSAYCGRACGTARYAYNWGLAEWRGIYEAGEQPSMAVVKRRCNARRKAELPWTYEVTTCASGQAVERWCCSACGADHKRDANAAIVLRKLGLANTELTRGDMAPLSTCAGMPTSTVAEPRTEAERTCAHI